jgi:uncharacterized protein (TIGR00725 family)
MEKGRPAPGRTLTGARADTSLHCPVKRPILAIIGNRLAASPEVLGLAARAGRAALDRGFHLACGGLGGVMEAACRGAVESPAHGEGLVLGVLPGTDTGAANAFCDLAVATGMGIARNVVLVTTADAILVVGGGAGTLSEVALAWQLGKPIAAVAPSGGWAARLAGRPVDDQRQEAILRADSPEEAVDRLRQALAARQRRT